MHGDHAHKQVTLAVQDIQFVATRYQLPRLGVVGTTALDGKTILGVGLVRRDKLDAVGDECRVLVGIDNDRLTGAVG